MIELYKTKENDKALDLAERINALESELDAKEYDIESLKKQLDKAEELLKEYSNDNNNVAEFFKESAGKSPEKLSNIIKERDEINLELDKTRKRIDDLELENHDLNDINEKLKISIEGCKLFGGNSVTPGKFNIPSLDFSNLKNTQNKPITDTIYIHKLEESIKYLSKRSQELEDENREVLQTNMQLKNSNKSLLQLNTTLNNSIKILNEQLIFYKRTQEYVKIGKVGKFQS